MKVLIYGAKGWIGQKVTNFLKLQKIEFIEAVERADSISVIFEIDKVKPSHVLCLVGRTHGLGFSTIDYLEQNGKLVENLRDNLYGPVNLALACIEKDVHLTYMGTGCIFTYDQEHEYGNEHTGFKEKDLPNFTGSSYSTVKGFTDRLMNQIPGVLNLRIRMPISLDSSSRNFITKITTYDKICSIPNSMSVLEELIPIMIDMMSHGKTGTRNFTNPGLISHNEILEMYKEIVDPSFTWKNFTLEEQNQILAAGRSNNCLDTKLIQHEYPKLNEIKTAVRNTLLQMKTFKDSNPT
jgi:3,5-epimerase/4-reductase